MKKNSGYLNVLPLAPLFFLAGCAVTGTTVVSKMDRSVVRAEYKIMVVSQIAWVDKAWAKAFETALLSDARAKDHIFAVQTRDPLALHSDKLRYAGQIEDLKPDLVLVIEPGDGTVDQKGRNLMRRFEAGMYKDYNSKSRRELIWRATLKVEPSGGYIQEKDMAELSRELVNCLIRDGFIREPPPHAARLQK